MKTMKYGIDQLIHSDSERPMLLEVFTDIDADNRALEDITSKVYKTGYIQSHP